MDHRPCGGRRLSSGRADAHFTAEGGRWWSSCSSYAPSLAKVDNQATHPPYLPFFSLPSSHLTYLPHHRIRLLFLPSQRLFPLCTLLRLSFSYRRFPLLSLAYATRHPFATSFSLLSFPPFSAASSRTPPPTRRPPRAAFLRWPRPFFHVYTTWKYESGGWGGATPFFFFTLPLASAQVNPRWSSETTQQRASTLPTFYLFFFPRLKRQRR